MLTADDNLTSPLYTLTVVLPENTAEQFVAQVTELFEDGAISASYFRPKENVDYPRDWSVRWLIDYTPDMADIAAQLKTAGVEQKAVLEPVMEGVNWLEYSYQQFPPLDIGCFFVYGSHYKDSLPEGKIALQIDAATAFGSGEHGTTHSCLMMLDYMNDQNIKPLHSLDMGTGSGILAAAALKLWGGICLAADNDREAVRVAALHRDLNAIDAAVMPCLHSEGYADKQVQQQAPYDLIIANILARPLIEMAGDLAACLKPQGYAVLSGLLVTQEDEVLEAHKKHGLKKLHHIHREGWSALLLQKE